jgi:hypothetical protein
MERSVRFAVRKNQQDIEYDDVVRELAKSYDIFRRAIEGKTDDLGKDSGTLQEQLPEE